VDLTSVLRRRSHRQFRATLPVHPPDPEAPFAEVTATLSTSEAVVEASRCLDCDTYCSTCESVCPNRAIFTYRIEPLQLELPVLRWNGPAVTEVGREAFSVEQPYQVAVLNELCNECGNCTTFCPTADRPFADKPRLFLERREFVRQSENAFMIGQRDGRWHVEGVFAGCRHELVIGRPLRYRSPTVEVEVDAPSFDVVRASGRDGHAPSDDVSLRPCAVLYVLYMGITGSTPWIPTAVEWL
jgi:putative selenate reductase